MAFTDAVITALRGHAGLQALTTNGDSPATYRIYNLVLPQNQSSDSIVIERLSITEINSLTDAGGTGVENVRLRVTAYSSTISGAIALNKQAGLALKAATTLKSISIMAFDDYEADTNLFKVIADFSIWYK